MLTLDLNQSLDDFFKSTASAVTKDLKINFKRVITQSSLSDVEAMLATAALARASQNARLEALATDWLASQSAVDQEMLNEALESAAIMGMLTTYYRFRHMLADGYGGSLPSDYQQAGLRMTALARPALGKKRFEMLAFTLAVYYGCPSCMISHEQALLGHDVLRESIHHLARLASIVKGLRALS